MENVLICTLRSTWATASHSHWSTQSQTQTASCRRNLNNDFLAEVKFDSFITLMLMKWKYCAVFLRKYCMWLIKSWDVIFLKCFKPLPDLNNLIICHSVCNSNQLKPVYCDFPHTLIKCHWLHQSDPSHKMSLRNIQSHRHRWCFIPFYEPSGSSGRALCASAILSAICQLPIYMTLIPYEKSVTKGKSTNIPIYNIKTHFCRGPFPKSNKTICVHKAASD